MWRALPLCRETPLEAVVRRAQGSMVEGWMTHMRRRRENELLDSCASADPEGWEVEWQSLEEDDTSDRVRSQQGGSDLF
jgi:hypothetical protein